MNSMLNLVVLFLVVRNIGAARQGEIGFTYNGFKGANLSLDKIAEITSNGLLILTNRTRLEQQVHAFYANTRGLPSAFPNQYLGIFNKTNIGKSSTHKLAVELDLLLNWEFNNINDNHIGTDIIGLVSVVSAPPSFFDETNHRYMFLSHFSGLFMHVWVNYDGVGNWLSGVIKYDDLSPVMPEYMSKWQAEEPNVYSPFNSGLNYDDLSLGMPRFTLYSALLYDGQAEEPNVSQLPGHPRKEPRKKPTIVTTRVVVLASALVLLLIFCALLMVGRKRKFEEVLEEWELNYGPYRFKYKDLYVATKGFKQEELLGIGGFGRVYKGILPNSRIEVAVKKVSHESRQGMKEFVAEIVSIGRLRHRNLVTLLGYCRRKAELLLVYEFMPNGSLDKFLFDPNMPNLNWCHRFRIIRGIASALFYLHEGWEQVVIHRDVKSANVLLDAELNGKLGDFGLARLHNHGANPQTTTVVGTLGYLAPEFSRTGRPNPSTDVFAFGMFMSEVVCGRRPIDPSASSSGNVVLVDRIFSCWREGRILDMVDPKLGRNYVEEETELVLKLGLLCSHCVPARRPSMRQVVHYLEGELPLPDLSSLTLSAFGVPSVDDRGFNNFINLPVVTSTSITDAVLSGGR